MVNGKEAKASYQVKIGDIIEISLGNKNIRVRVDDVSEVVKKESASSMYTVLS